VASRVSIVQRRAQGLSTRQEDGETCDAACFTERVLEVVYEIVSTIRAIILAFGLGKLTNPPCPSRPLTYCDTVTNSMCLVAPFLSQINPLLLALSALILSLDVLVTGLLLTVTAVVTTLLGGLGIALLLLGWGI
jgi:hypothetical protein